MSIEELLEAKAVELEHWAREHGIIDNNQTLHVRMEIVQRLPAVSFTVVYGKRPRLNSPKTRSTNLPVLETDWDIVLSLRLNQIQKTFLHDLKEGGNAGVKPQIVDGYNNPQPSFSALELINTKLRECNSSLRLRAIGRGGMFGTRAYKLFHVE